MDPNLHPHLIRLRPRDDTHYISHNRSVMATDRCGTITGGPDHGFFVRQARLLSHYRYLVNGEEASPVAVSNVEQHSWMGYYITVPPGGEALSKDGGSGQIENPSQRTLELRVSRFVGDGMHEDLDLTNFSPWKTSFELSVELDADFADPEELQSKRKQHGRISRRWEQDENGDWRLELDYRASHHFKHQGGSGTAELHRGLRLRIRRAGSIPEFRKGSARKAQRLVFQVTLEPHERWHACLDFIPLIDGEPLAPDYGCRSFSGTHSPHDWLREDFLRDSTRFTTRDPESLAAGVERAIAQARRDLAALRLYDFDVDPHAWTVAAGLPIYIALFGRDMLTAGWQAAPLTTEIMRGTLPVLARLQGTKTDDWRDEQPGRMLHEAHIGPLEILNFNPRERYYGSITTSSFYPVVVAELWHWTGDKSLVEPLIDPALEGLRWLDETCKSKGFYSYKTRSEQGVENQAWKDSGDAMVDENGAQVEQPIATCEEQGFVYTAKLHLSGVLWWFGRKDEARRLHAEAEELKRTFNEKFWMEEEGFVAMGMDAEGRLMRSIGSNAGHCVATGIVDTSRIKKICGRLLEEDLFSGWGIRTLSSRNPDYNPFSYHRGSVWPVEQGTFALGFMRYGLNEEVARLARAQFEAASLFDHYRLPEVFSGHPRDDDHPFPALYPQANSPQAWSASTIFSFVQAMLGLYPYAPLKILLVDPHLPEWLPRITLSNLRVGEAVVTIRFFRKSNGSSGYKVLEKKGSLHVLRQPSPWSLTATFVERAVDALQSLLPKK